jgi:hypothetical protein
MAPTIANVFLIRCCNSSASTAWRFTESFSSDVARHSISDISRDRKQVDGLSVGPKYWRDLNIPIARGAFGSVGSAFEARRLPELGRFDSQRRIQITLTRPEIGPRATLQG